MEIKKKENPFLENLKALNESVTKWINEHVSGNPHVDLTPIFADYKSHLSDIESKVHIKYYIGLYKCPSCLCSTRTHLKSQTVKSQSANH